MKTHSPHFYTDSVPYTLPNQCSTVYCKHLAVNTGLTEVVPDVHLSTEGSHLDDGLTQEVIGLPLKLLLHA